MICFQRTLSRSIALATLTLTPSLSLVLLDHALAATPQQVSIQFEAMVADQPFACGQSYADLGRAGTEVTPTDFRFYVSEVALIEAQGQAIPVELEQDGKWQYQTVALLDFEDKSGPCANGTVDLRDQVVGTVPAGEYQGIQFTLGIPFELNHEDVTLAASPLNLTSLWWNWQGGYKFLRIDLETPMAMQMSMDPTYTQTEADHAGHNDPKADGTHSAHASHAHEGHSATDGFLIHLGSTGCEAEANQQQPSSCSHRNAPLVVFSDFDPTQNTIVADLAALVAENDLSMNQPQTALGCMSEPEDGDCGEIFSNLGLSWNGTSAPDQTFFRVR